jgi:predicted nucleotidyltransferase
MNNQILNIYMRGSHVYGTNDEESDVDYLFVVDHHKEKESQFAGQYSVMVHPAGYFQELIDQHRPSALECIFLPEEFKIESRKFNLDLDLAKLRRSFSAKASNSWVKAKKKIDVHGEHRKGRKSLFHALRILLFGIQIAEHGKIVDFGQANCHWHQIQRQNFAEWQCYQGYWQPVYKNLKSRLREVAPL